MDNSVKNSLILLPIFAGISYAGYLLYKDYYQNPTNVEQVNGNREVVGQMLTVDNNVKRQLGDDVLWNSIERETPVYNKDSIRTGKDSDAQIRLTDGTMIELGESSLIILDKTPDALNLDFKAGDISALNSGQDLQINVKDSKIKANGADLKIKTGADQKAQIQVEKGKASVTDKNKKQTDLGQSEAADLDEDGVKQITKIAVLLKSPLNKTQVQSNVPEVPQPFIWEVTDPSLKQEQFEISKDGKFSSGNTKLRQGHQGLTANLVPGTYFWRVGWRTEPANPKSKINYSDIWMLNIGLDKRLELVEPDNGTNFDFTPEENALELDWNSRVQPKLYTTEVSASRDFKNLVANHTMKETKDMIKDLPSGNYFWRVRAFDENNQEMAVSPIYSFSIHLKIPRLPELIKPVQAAVWETPIPLTFSWKKMDTAAKYRIQISTDQEQHEIEKTKTDEETTFSWKPANEGTYYWSVKALNQKNKFVGQSEIRRFQFHVKDIGAAFMLVSPKDLTEITRDLTGQAPEPIMFEWKVLRTLPGPMTIQIGHDHEFKDSIKQDKLTKENLPVRLRTPGTYFWRLSSVSDDGKYQDVSPIWSFSVKSIVNLLAPEVIEPSDKDNIEISGASPVKFSWKPVANAAQYHIVVQTMDARTQKQVTVMDQMVKETSVSSKPLPEGKYTWTLTSVDAQTQDGLSGRSYSFGLVPPVQMDAPQLNAPVVK